MVVHEVVSVARSVHEVEPAAWDALVGPDDPFVEHAFLAALEDGGCLGARAGWIPHHLLLHRDGRLVAAAPLHQKLHGWGEYIFDWGWAEAAERAGLRYYPKLTAMVPFTPATGRRLLTAPDVAPAWAAQVLGRAAVELAAELGASSVHWLFCTAVEASLLGDLPLHHRRLTHQFHWTNRGWPDVEAYLADMTARRRKEIRRERRLVVEAGVEVRLVQGPELTAGEWEALYRFYRLTVARHGGSAYLTRGFFDRLAATAAHRVVAVLARRHGRPIAGAIAFHKGTHLFGRWWGAEEDVPALHFECCYHRLVEHALAAGVTRFESGAQGEHKLQRGFLPALVHSVHHLRHPGLGEAVARWLAQDRARERALVARLGRHGPFRPGEAAGGRV